jgi:glutathione S-transferase
MLELYQTEWCPASRRVRQRLTELGVDYIVHQVPVDKHDRIALRQRTDTDTIPAFTLDNGTVLVGESEILRHLDEHIAEPTQAEAHRLKAGKARRRYLEEECECSQPATH